MLSFTEFLSEAFALTLKYHGKLNPKLWKGDDPVHGLSDTLLRHARRFAQFSGIAPSAIVDVVMTGGNANYNYTKFSDIDVHLICKISEDQADRLYSKKAEWAQKNPGLKFAGYPLEFYAERAGATRPSGQGVYSLKSGEWITEPRHLDRIDVLKDPRTVIKIKHEIAYIRKHLLKGGTKDQILKYKERLWRMRSSGLERAGEFSIENLTYKELRNRGLVDRLNERLKKLS